jgi:hypothetical protein
MTNKGIYKGIYFDDIHSFYDLNLILAPFVPVPAEPKTNYIDITGGDGSLDLTEGLGEVKYKDRNFAFTFSINPSEKMTFDEKVSQVSNALNGKAFKITLDRDPEYYWEGRCIVDKYAQNKKLGQISVKATVRPYKLKQNETVASFSLTSEAKEITLKNGRKSVVPEITCTNDNTWVYFGLNFWVLGAGTHRILDIYLKEGNNLLQVSGRGTITFAYQEAEL